MSPASASPLHFKPFDATTVPPMIMPTVEPLMQDAPIVDERERQREEVKQNLQSIMRNKLFSETARVAAARELTRIFDSEEITELREEVKAMREYIFSITPNAEDLPPFMRPRR